jgi:hypothetical protein
MSKEKEEPLDFLARQAQELNMGYEMSKIKTPKKEAEDRIELFLPFNEPWADISGPGYEIKSSIECAIIMTERIIEVIRPHYGVRYDFEKSVLHELKSRI